MDYGADGFDSRYRERNRSFLDDALDILDETINSLSSARRWTTSICFSIGWTEPWHRMVCWN